MLQWLTLRAGDDMTAQISEMLLFEGKKVAMLTEPLGDYFDMCGLEPPFRSSSTALWRGYVGNWEIINERLYIVGLHGNLVDGRDATLATVFPDFPQRVFAHWYSGEIRIPEGRMLRYVHAGYASVFERDLILEMERGLVAKVTVKDNSATTQDDDDDV